MKLIAKVLLFLTLSSCLIKDAFSLTNNEINKICQKKSTKENCIKRLRTNKYLLERGKPIEIPVIPFER